MKYPLTYLYILYWTSRGTGGAPKMISMQPAVFTCPLLLAAAQSITWHDLAKMCAQNVIQGRKKARLSPGLTAPALLFFFLFFFFLFLILFFFSLSVSLSHSLSPAPSLNLWLILFMFTGSQLFPRQGGKEGGSGLKARGLLVLVFTVTALKAHLRRGERDTLWTLLLRQMPKKICQATN